ncbi:MAG: hypothetical protein ACFFAS_13930 [Promethearchaeota archaeon]
MTFWILLSTIPIVGIYFLIIIPFRASELGLALGFGLEMTPWIAFSLFLILSLINLSINTFGTIKLLRENHKIKEKQGLLQKDNIKPFFLAIIIIILIVLISELILCPFLYFLII